MKVKYSPHGSGKNPTPKSWEVWLADAPFGPMGKTKRCPVAVGKRTTAGWTVYEIVPVYSNDTVDVILSDGLKSGQDRPSAIRLVPKSVQAGAFVQKMGVLTQADVGKVIASGK